MLTRVQLLEAMRASEAAEERIYRETTTAFFNEFQDPLKALYDEMSGATANLTSITVDVIRAHPRIVKIVRYCLTPVISQMRLGQITGGRLWRYATRGDAKRGHWQVVEALKAGQEPKPARGMRNPFDQLIDLMEGRFDPAELERELEEGTVDDSPE